MCEDLILGKCSPAEAFHPGVFIREEMAAQGWSVETMIEKSGLRRECWIRLQAAFDGNS